MIYRVISFLKSGIMLVIAFVVALFLYDCLKGLWRIYISKK